jgi:hypothetical protein
MRSLSRTFIAVISGFLAMTLLVIAGTVAATALLLPGGLHAVQGRAAPAHLPPAYLAANLAISLAAAVAGGWLAARLAVAAPFAHAAALAGVVLVMSVGSMPAAQPGHPAWYGWAIAVVGMAGVLAGGWLLVAMTHRTRTAAEAALGAPA